MAVQRTMSFAVPKLTRAARAELIAVALMEAMAAMDRDPELDADAIEVELIVRGAKVPLPTLLERPIPLATGELMTRHGGLATVPAADDLRSTIAGGE